MHMGRYINNDITRFDWDIYSDYVLDGKLVVRHEF